LYDKPFKQKNLNRCALAAGLLLLSVYGLLPEQYRFSRGIIFLSAILVYLSVSLLRWLMVRWGILESANDVDEEKQTVVVANAEEYTQAVGFYTAAGIAEKLLGRIDPGNNPAHAIGNVNELASLQKKVLFREIIFCAGQMSYLHIIEQIQQMGGACKITVFGAGTQSMVGSESKDASGQSLTPIGKFRLATPASRRCKRLVDLFFSFFLLLLSPLLIWRVKQKSQWVNHLSSILIGKKTWVGYSLPHTDLPVLRKSILATNGLPHSNNNLSEETLQQLDYRYARNYRCRDDVRAILISWSLIDKK
jgi:hypothetical protein